jgi:hypothetical protein
LSCPFRHHFGGFWTPLGWALSDSAAAVVNLLLQFGADRNAVCVRWEPDGSRITPLTYALYVGCPAPVIAALLLAGADPTVTSYVGHATVTPETYSRNSTACERVWSEALQMVRSQKRRTVCKRVLLVILGCRRYRSTVMQSNHMDVVVLLCKALWDMREDAAWDHQLDR